MSDAIIITLIIMGGLLLIAAVLVGGIEGQREKSLFAQAIQAYHERLAAKLEKTKALHEKMCPRVTDTPREKS